MGYKRLLAIVAQAPDKIAKLKPEIRDINKAVTSGPGSRKFREKDKGGLGGTWSNYEPLEKFHFVPQNNFRPTGDGKPELMFRDHVQPQFVVKAESCFRCGINCHKNVYEKNADGTRGAFLAKFDYEPVNLLSTNIAIHDPRKAATLISLVDRLGMDNISLGTTISYVMDYNERHPDAPILNGATFGDFDKARDLVEGAGTGRFPEVGRGVKRLSQSLGETGYAMGRQSQLGPIDPQIPVGGRYISARSITDQFEQARTDVLANRETAHVWAPILQALGPGLLQEAQNAQDYDEQMVSRWLQGRMRRTSIHPAISIRTSKRSTASSVRRAVT